MLKYLMLFTLIAVPQTLLAKQCPKNLDFQVRTLNGSEMIHLCDAYQDKVVLIVNTASKCGYTGQYEGLEALYAKHKDDGLVVLGFPSNDFGGQEPGTEQEIASFCINTYAVKFPMFQKTNVKKHHADPLYRQLGDQAGYPRWNFHKYLLDREGNLVESYRSGIAPESEKLVSRVEALLAE
ncbi:MAG: glutathione peroxidase [Gammaproteobacteria bacterium]|nr:glutathione peroxidase [Gammaproteobacteria bacterium]